MNEQLIESFSMFTVILFPRRQVIRFSGGLACAVVAPSIAQSLKKVGNATRNLTIAQLVDTSQAQQDIAKGFFDRFACRVATH